MAGYGITYHNHYDGDAGSGYSLDSGTDRYIVAMHGFGMQGIGIPTQRAPYQDGASLLGAPFTTWPPPFGVDWPQSTPYFPPRELEVIVRLNCTSTSELVTDYAGLVRAVTPFAPAFQGDSPYLYITKPDTTIRQIECFCTGVSDMERKGLYNAFVTLTFFAPIPFFHQTWGDAASATAWVTSTNPKTITNIGDAPFWPVFKVFGSASTTIVGLHLTNNTTGKIWSTTQTIAVGATKYIVAYMDRAKMNYYNAATHADIIGTLDTDAEFWPLRIGANALQWSSTSGTPSSIEVSHMWYYNGV